MSELTQALGKPSPRLCAEASRRMTGTGSALGTASPWSRPDPGECTWGDTTEPGGRSPGAAEGRRVRARRGAGRSEGVGSRDHARLPAVSSRHPHQPIRHRSFAMRIIRISAASDPAALSGASRVMGVIPGQPELDDLIRALEAVGVSTVEILEGESGAGYLHQRERSFRAFLDLFLEDLETEMRHRYALEVEQGRLVFAVPVTRSNKEAVIEAVRARGASHVAHFGMWVNESIGQT